MNDPNKPDYTDPEIQEQQPAVKLCRDVYKGTLHLRNLGTEYLPQFPREDHGSYRQRVSTAVLYNALRRTVRGLAGIVFQRDPYPTKTVPKEIKEHFNNIDLAGRNFASFAQDTYDDSLLDGHHVLFIDMPANDEPVASRAEEAPRRPYWKGIRKEQIIRQRWGIIDYRVQLMRFAFVDSVYEPKGPFGLEGVSYVREYNVLITDPGEPNEVLFRLFRKVERGVTVGAGKWEMVDERILIGIDEIPVVYHYTNRESIGVSTPPLLDLATENVAHFQLTSDRRNSLHVAGIPIPVLIGIDEDEPVEISTKQGIQLPDGGEAFYLEPRGSSLEQSRMEIGRLRRYGWRR